MKVREVFARNLNMLCVDIGNYSQVARELGITRQQLRKHLQAESLPTERTLARMARFFGVEETDLVDPRFRQDNSSTTYRYAQAIKAALDGTDRADLPEGRFDLYFSYLGHPGHTLRALVLVNHAGAHVEFRRLTSFYPRQRADWRFFRGDHHGVAVQTAGTIYLCGINRLPTHEPTLVALQKVATSAPLYRGQSMVMDLNGDAISAVVMTVCPCRSLRDALRRTRMLSIDDHSVPVIVRRELNHMMGQIGSDRM